MAFDITVYQKELNTNKVAELSKTIKSEDYNSIASFGAGVSEQISKCSDKLLQTDATEQVTKTEELMTTINKLMLEFDMKDLEPKEDKSFIDKIMHRAKRELDKVVSKYNGLNKEVEKVYVTIRSYVDDVKQSNKNIVEEFNAQVNYYQSLREHIAACEQASSLIEESNDDNAKALLQTKLTDLKSAEAISVQSLLMLKVREFNNINLARKIDNAFIITLPLFKQQLNQAIELKKQSIQAKALSLLDEKTNEMLLKNAQNAIDTAKTVTQLASSSSIKMETIEQTYGIIMNGVKEIQDIQRATYEEQKKNIEKLKAFSLNSTQDNHVDLIKG